MAETVAGELYVSITGQLFEIGRQLRQPNGYPFDPLQLRVALQAAIEGRFGQGQELVSYPVSIDYSRSLATMIFAGKYDWVHSDITEKRFPVQGSGIVGRELVLCHYDRPTERGEPERLIEHAGYELASIEDLLSFGEKYPEKQRNYPIIPLGSTAEVHGRHVVPYLGRDGSGRGLRLASGDGWGGHCRFLARKHFGA